MNEEYYSSLLVQLKDILKVKRRVKLTKVFLFLDNSAPAYRALATPKKLSYLGFQCLYHGTYSSDFDPSHYQLFPGLKKQLKGAIFVRRGFHCCRGDLVGRIITRKFFAVACKS
jgi:hypothetical protein